MEPEEVVGNSIFSDITSAGGGGGYGAVNINGPGANGGSGGGGSGEATNAGGSATPSGQGNSGGSGIGDNSQNYFGGGGGGGAGSVGANAGSTGGNGGIGLAVNILNPTQATAQAVGQVSGSDVYYSGGGGGGAEGNAPGTGGTGGGGTGGRGVPGSTATDGTPNTGGGAGGEDYYLTPSVGRVGGSGVVILKYPTANTITISAGLTYSSIPGGSYSIVIFTAGTGGTVSFASVVVTGRPSSPTEGLMRENTTTGKMEFYDGSLWQEITDTASSYSPGLIPAANFNTVLYPGNGGTKSVTGVGFKPGLNWIKQRNGSASHSLQDIIRGPGQNFNIYSDNNQSQGAYGVYGYMSSFDDDGFTVEVASGSHTNNGTTNYVSWNWKAGGAATTINAGTVSNDVSSDVSANTDAGFSIVKYTGTLSSAGNIDVAHGLGAAPEIIISKRTDSTGSWRVRPFFLNSNPYNYLELDTSGAIQSINSSDGTMAMPTNNVFSNNWNSGLGAIGNVIAYCWRSIPGYSKIGFYVGNGSTTGPEIYTGFKPAWLMTKPTTSGYWYVLDNKRNTSNPRNTGLFPNDGIAEITNTDYNVDFNNTGFQPKNNTIGFNNLGVTYIYMTFAE